MARVLVIDNSYDVLSASKRILERKGHSYTIQACENIELCVRLVRESLPDLLLIDLDSAGLEGLNHILRAPETASIPIIVAATDTNHLGRISCIFALWSGVRDYVLKPIETDDLINRVQTLMQLS